MATEQVIEKKPTTILEFTQALHSTAVKIMNGDFEWNKQKKTMILEMRDLHLDMMKKGFYDKPKSEICADICEILRIHHADENSFAYVRMVLDEEYKDQTHTTHYSIIKRAFKIDKEAIDKDKINLLAPLKKEDFDGLSPEEKLLYKREFLDVIKESKRRIRDNRTLVNIVCEDNQINQALVTGQKFPDMNQKVLSILTELRKVIKDVKKINRSINIEADKATDTDFNYNEELDAIYNTVSDLSTETNLLVTRLN